MSLNRERRERRERREIPLHAELTKVESEVKSYKPNEWRLSKFEESSYINKKNIYGCSIGNGLQKKILNLITPGFLII